MAFVWLNAVPHGKGGVLRLSRNKFKKQSTRLINEFRHSLLQ